MNTNWLTEFPGPARTACFAPRSTGMRERPCAMHEWPRAFTLIEVLVVVSIIALLICILLPSLGRVRENSKAAVCASNQHQLAVAATAYTTANRDWMNPIEDW